MKKIFMTFLTLILCRLSFAYINISPTSFDKNIGVGAYQEFTLYNNTKIPIRYKITPKDMNDKKVGNMTNWIEVYPKIVTINPLEEKTFKVYVKSPKNEKTGDYGAFLNIKQISAPKLKSDSKNVISSGLTVMTNLNMGLYGYVGENNPKIEIKNVKTYTKNNQNYINFDLNNNTDRLVRVIVDVEGSNKGYYPIGEYRAFKNEELDVNQEIKNLKSLKNATKLIIRDKETNNILKTIKL
ncbi:hypothetical protein [Cetobacterium sp. SF1]|uniref:hypothetical protein n=1 Tax=Cetobacterium sp. SF1 TaxID=3417654 RepID=UPI003CF4D1D0